MKVLKPHWVSHDGCPIYSIDIHPDGTRFATGGQGEDSGRVVIWNMAPVADEAAEFDEKVPKMLCQLDHHLACVNCVRWSYSGKYLASGGDDKMIMVWVVAKSGSSSVFGSKAVNVESWRCASTLKRHDGDVLDIAWSPNDIWLATCSVDNTVIVWDAHNLPEVIAVLKGHTGLVKGVTWDPVGKYLSSQSDDKSLRIWRTSNWQEEAVITKPFEECGGSTLVLRLSWSPDGLYLVSAHAMNNNGPTAQIIEREGWRHDIDFVGHRKAVTCVRFNSNILSRDFTRSGKPQHACCCAIGSRDKAVSIWVTALKRPLVVMEKLFKQPILDLTWSSNGLQLMGCSLDGTVVYFEFSVDELGRPLNVDEKNALYEKTYGKSFANSTPSSAVVLENPSLVMNKKPKIVETVAPKPPATPTKSPSTPAVITTTPSKPVHNKQIETRTSDGRRRITPVFIPAEIDSGDGPSPFNSEPIKFSTTNEPKSRIEIERRDEVVAPNITASVKSFFENKESNRQRTKEDAQASESTLKPVAPFKRNLEKTMTVVNKKPAPRFPENRPSTSTSSANRDGGNTGICLPCPHLQPVTRYMVPGVGKCLVVENEVCLSPFGRLTQVKLMHAGKQLWETVLGSVVCVFCANAQLVVLACADSSIHVLHTQSGTRVLPALVLGAPTAHLALTGAKLMSVTVSGRCNVWCLERRTSLVSDNTVHPLLNNPGKINRCHITNSGVPIVVLDSGRAYMYSLEFKSWMRLADHTDATVRNTQRSVLTAWQNLPDSSGDRPLRTVQAQCKSSVERSLVHRQDNTVSCTRSFLEDQLVVCKALDSVSEFRFWFVENVRFLLKEGLEPRVRDVCDTLMRDPDEADKSCLWDPSPLGIERLGLLKDVLSEMTLHPQMQRLYTEMNDQLNCMETS